MLQRFAVLSVPGGGLGCVTTCGSGRSPSSLGSCVAPHSFANPHKQSLLQIGSVDCHRVNTKFVAADTPTSDHSSMSTPVFSNDLQSLLEAAVALG